MASEAERARFRRRLSGTEASMPDDYIDTIFSDMESDWPTSDRKVIIAASILEGARELMAAATRYTDYTQNQTKESLRQVFLNLEKLVEQLEKEFVAVNVQNTLPAVMWGRGKNTPTRLREYPDGNP